MQTSCEVLKQLNWEKEIYANFMVHIILLILKIIGIILLCIAGILLLAIACVLCVPVRYRIRLTREEGADKSPVEVYVKVTWLLHLINILVRYPAEVVVRARILVFTVFRVPEKEKKARKAKKSEKQRNAKRSSEEENLETDGETETGVRADADAVTNTQEATISEETKVSAGSAATEEDEPLEVSEEKESLFSKIRKIITKIKGIIEKIKGFFKNIQYTIRKFCDKIKAVLDNIQYYREILEGDPFRQSFESCKRELGWVLKKLKPDKFDADFIVGMEDPATTGEILAICGMLYPLIGQHVRIVGDFDCEKTHIEGRLYIRGRIRAITFIRTAVRIYFNKDIKKLIKVLKKEAA